MCEEQSPAITVHPSYMHTVHNLHVLHHFDRNRLSIPMADALYRLATTSWAANGELVFRECKRSTDPNLKGKHTMWWEDDNPTQHFSSEHRRSSFIFGVYIRFGSVWFATKMLKKLFECSLSKWNVGNPTFETDTHGDTASFTLQVQIQVIVSLLSNTVRTGVFIFLPLSFSPSVVYWLYENIYSVATQRDYLPLPLQTEIVVGYPVWFGVTSQVFTKAPWPLFLREPVCFFETSPVQRSRSTLPVTTTSWWPDESSHKSLWLDEADTAGELAHPVLSFTSELWGRVRPTHLGIWSCFQVRFGKCSIDCTFNSIQFGFVCIAPNHI